jgi:hypothetical protein
MFNKITLIKQQSINHTDATNLTHSDNRYYNHVD